MSHQKKSRTRSLASSADAFLSASIRQSRSSESDLWKPPPKSNTSRDPSHGQKSSHEDSRRVGGAEIQKPYGDPVAGAHEVVCRREEIVQGAQPVHSGRG